MKLQAESLEIQSRMRAVQAVEEIANSGSWRWSSSEHCLCLKGKLWV